MKRKTVDQVLNASVIGAFVLLIIVLKVTFF